MKFFRNVCIPVLGLMFLLSGCGPRFVSTFPEAKPSAEPVINENSPRLENGKVVFTYTTRRRNIQSVALVGTFNDWNQTHTMLSNVEDGVWRVIADIMPGRHEYKFLIDGSMWVPDPNNPVTTDDGWNNSIIVFTSDDGVSFPVGDISAENPSFYYYNYTARESDDWIKEAVIYEIFVRVFSEDGFDGIVERLDYLSELGVDTLWLMPIHPIGEVERKGTLGSPYSVKDYYGINPEFGNKEDFRNLVETAHSKGFRVILDWVPNHSAWDNPLTKRNPSWYQKDEDGNIIFPKNTDWYDVAQFDYDNPEMREYMHNALEYWIKEFNIDGYRMDVAPLIPDDFWTYSIAKLREIKPDIMMLAESENEPNHHTVGFDLTYAGVMGFALNNIITGNDTQYNFHRAYNRMRYSFPKGSLRMHWLENHDQMRAIAKFGTVGIYPASVVLMTLDGVPMLYMGQEFGDTRWTDWRSLFDAMQMEWEKSDETLFNHYKNLAALRASSKAFTHGELILIENDNKKCVSYLRVYGDDKYLVIANLSRNDTEVLISPRDAKANNINLKQDFEGLIFGIKRSNEKYSKEGVPFEIGGWETLVIKLK